MILFTFLHPVLEALKQGRIIRTTVAWVLRGMALLSILGGLVGFFAILAEAFNQKGALVLALVVIALLVCALALVAFQILWRRGADVLELGDSSYTVIPILGILLRAWGELGASSLLFLGLASCLGAWTGINTDALLGGAVGSGRQLAALGAGEFIAGIACLLAFSLGAFLVLTFAYFLAEALVAIVDMARNTAAARQILQGAFPSVSGPSNSLPLPAEAPVIPSPIPAPEPVPPPAPAPHLCPRCGCELAPAMRFCESCGTLVG